MAKEAEVVELFNLYKKYGYGYLRGYLDDWEDHAESCRTGCVKDYCPNSNEAAASFDRAEKVSECQHPLHQLTAPVPESGRGVVPRTVLSCGGCGQLWNGGQALAVFLASAQKKTVELEKKVLNRD